MEEFLRQARRSHADVGCEPPDPPLSNEDMQRVTFVAKREVIRILRERAKTSRRRQR